MDDRRIEQALREGPPDEPAYVPGTERAAGPLGDEGADALPTRIRPAVRARREGPGRLGSLLPLAAVVAIAIAGVVLRLDLSPGATPSPTRNDMLGRITSDGVVHIAVSDEAPQTEASGGAFIGFDLDVANAVAGKLGVRPDIQLVSPAEILADSGDWELAFPSHALPDTLIGAVAGPRYYAWPSWVVVESASTVGTIADLDRASICVVDGAPGADWLSGMSVPDTAYLTPAPVEATIVRRATDDDCLAALATGEAKAAITANLLDIDFAARGLRPIVESPVIRQQRALLLRDSSALGDPTSLQAALAAAISDLRATGQLSELSRRAFGGEDLTGDLP